MRHLVLVILGILHLMMWPVRVIAFIYTLFEAHWDSGRKSGVKFIQRVVSFLERKSK